MQILQNNYLYDDNFAIVQSLKIISQKSALDIYLDDMERNKKGTETR